MPSSAALSLRLAAPLLSLFDGDLVAGATYALAVALSSDDPDLDLAGAELALTFLDGSSVAPTPLVFTSTMPARLAVTAPPRGFYSYQLTARLAADQPSDAPRPVVGGSGALNSI